METHTEAAPAPMIVGIGGTTRPNSATERALKIALEAAEAQGARTMLLVGKDIDLPSYSVERDHVASGAERMIAALREADGIVIASPGYHGSISGLVKNALDYAEELRGDERCYFDGRAVGCIATAGGWQGAVVTLSALRDVVHALRGWPTPVGVAINSAEQPSEPHASGFSQQTYAQLKLMASQIVEFAKKNKVSRVVAESA